MCRDDAGLYLRGKLYRHIILHDGVSTGTFVVNQSGARDT
jgi:hypothetical protein